MGVHYLGLGMMRYVSLLVCDYGIAEAMNRMWIEKSRSILSGVELGYGF